MRTTILVGKIGPAFSTKSGAMGCAEIHCYRGSTIRQHYIGGEIGKLLTREHMLNLMFNYAAEEFGVSDFTPLYKVL